MGKVVVLNKLNIPVIERIDQFARSSGLSKKNGAYFRDGKYYGNLYSVGKEAGIDMQEGR